jgi:PAS domain S-box-containing protein
MNDLAQSSDMTPGFLRAAVDAARLLIAVVDTDGWVRATNRAFERATGLPKEACRRPIWELAALPEEKTLLRQAFTQFAERRPPESVTFHLVGDEGSVRIVDWNLRVVRPAGEPTIVVLSGLDVSSRVAAEEHFREFGTLQRLVLDRLPAVVWTTDESLRFTYNGGGGLAALGFTPGDVALIGTSLYSYFHTEDPDHVAIAHHLRALAGERVTFRQEWNGRIYESRIEPLRDRHERIIGTIGLAFDVTDQVRAAEALRDREMRLRRLVESNVIGIVFSDDAGRFTEANEAFLRLVGFERHELLSRMSVRDLTPAEYRPLDDRALAEMSARGTCVPYEKEYIAKDGTRVPVLVGAAELGEAGDATGRVAFILDLREQVRLRQARDRLLLKEQKARLETEIANARLMLLVEGSERLSRTTRADDTFETLSNLVVPCLADWSYVVHRDDDGRTEIVAASHADPSKRELVGRLREHRPDLAAPEGAPRVFRTGEVALYEKVTTEELAPDAPGWPILGTRDPEYLHLLREIGMTSVLCVPIPGRTGTEAVLVLVWTSGRRRYDQDDVVLARNLAHRAAVSLDNGRLLAEALESVRARDDFLAVAAHELRTPLTSLLLQIQMLGHLCERGDVDRSAALCAIKTSEAHARRLSKLIDRLLEVARLANQRIPIRVEEVDLGELLDDVLESLAPELDRAGCDVEVRRPRRLVGRWDRERVEEVFRQLLYNAMKFGAGRPIEVDVSATPTHVRIAFRDHGIGIPREDQQRIFGRFERAVSTRHFGGLGLGLYVTVQILRAHQGSLTVESEPGQGACFIVDLPRRLDEAV